ncbi:MAG: hypothetical protein WBW33_04755 [Bryobacteraceae bacterium]
MTEADRQLNELFERYREACPEIEPSANFMPAIWGRIEKRGSFPLVFERLTRMFVAGAVAACLLLTVLTALPARRNTSPVGPATYADALYADSSAEKTYYTEAVRSTDNLVPEDYRH